MHHEGAGPGVHLVLVALAGDIVLLGGVIFLVVFVAMISSLAASCQFVAAACDPLRLAGVCFVPG